jgi:hypothetical protein
MIKSVAVLLLVGFSSLTAKGNFRLLVNRATKLLLHA